MVGRRKHGGENTENTGFSLECMWPVFREFLERASKAAEKKRRHSWSSAWRPL